MIKEELLSAMENCDPRLVGLLLATTTAQGQPGGACICPCACWAVYPTGDTQTSMQTSFGQFSTGDVRVSQSSLEACRDHMCVFA